ncbi:enoyl-CoA hydratase/isomerase family protein [Acidimangrovimonas sediminis]|uniref:enoyl-CoA hydratase/isomerase family protein n=1 Tax=Acidimangrovimonas sediminis TaxID=2056283 RepID=UPI000C7F9FF8|nr:enoyl-CoA hydratase/isomerase family protein [Acidimangrovimonas sediminis]
MGLTITNDDGIRILTLDEPARRNPAGHGVRLALRDALAEAERDPGVAGVVITGAGGQFSAGGDIRDQQGVTDIHIARERFTVARELMGRMARFSKPLVAAVEGWAAGGGFSLAAVCETVVAAEDARFAASFGGVGLIPDMGLLATLSARIGAGRAQRIFLSSGRLDAAEALRLGAIDEIAPPGGALSRATQVAREAAAVAPLPRMLVKDWFAAEIDRALDYERELQPFLMFSEDAAEGRAAFFEKRKPAFKGK